MPLSYPEDFVDDFFVTPANEQAPNGVYHIILEEPATTDHPIDLGSSFFCHGQDGTNKSRTLFYLLEHMKTQEEGKVLQKLDTNTIHWEENGETKHAVMIGPVGMDDNLPLKKLWKRLKVEDKLHLHRLNVFM